MKRVSLQEIANQLNISRITVSKVLNHKSGVSLETQKNVVNKLLENGYNIIDSDLVNLVAPENLTEKKCIAVVATAPEFSEYWLTIINTITNMLSDLKYDCIYCFLSNKEDSNSSLPEIINAKRISGIIVINVYDEKISRSLLESGVPTVFFDICPNLFNEGINGDIVLLDGCKSIFEITSKIIANGRKNIGFIGDITYSKTILERWNGYKTAMENHGIDIDSNFCHTHSSYGHYYYKQEIEELVNKSAVLPQSFICANDSIAFMLMDILTKKGYHIPEDIAVSGFDNIKNKFSETSNLTTVSANVDMLGQRLVKQILMRIELPELPNEIVYLEPKVIYRQTTSFCTDITPEDSEAEIGNVSIVE